MPLAGRKLLAGFLDAARSRVWVSCRVYPTDEVAALVRRKLFPLRLSAKQPQTRKPLLNES
jgi:hypothetical protein